MDRESLKKCSTLGQRLSALAERHTARRLPAYQWPRAFQPVIRRLESLQQSTNRFERHDAPRQIATALVKPVEMEEQDPGFTLPPTVRDRVEQIVGPGATHVIIHSNGFSDRIARAQSAEAVTYGRDVYFRSDRYRPDEDAGFSLLTHETRHVIEAMQPNASWHRATQAGVEREEHRARADETHALFERRSHPAPVAFPQLLPPSPNLPVAAAAPSPTSPVVTRPMTAPAGKSAPQASPAAAPQVDIEQLRASIYRDLMGQMRADFERGA